ASGAKLLLPPNCPAVYRWQRDNGAPPKREFDLGHAAHREVLGVGAEVVIVQKVTKDKTRVDADDYQTKSAQEHRDEIRAQGKAPLLRRELEQVQAMAAALRRHPRAAELLQPGTGRPEVSLFWRDWVTGVERRARPDWLIVHGDGRATVVDYKTTASPDPASVRKAIANLGYYMQHAFYEDGVHALGIAEDVDFLFVFQGKEPPYLPLVARVDGPGVAVGRARVDEALAIFARCQASGEWPGYSDEVLTVSLPPWITRDEGW
ncbi:PD-(D/E)XK nuclease-like domain-containing protein, partial [Mycolicibacterium sp.]|uniref:PD-(D/E)XK nuclease-like domain-containing protein n=1 Tax=Mycolicibacterium sp. TaxID=2320850 RepID=UPI00355D7292